MSTTNPDRAAVIKSLGRRLRWLRLAYGELIHEPTLNMGDFARLLGVEEERYRTWERGVREMPLWMLLRIKHITGCSSDTLLEGAISPPGKEIFEPDIAFFERSIEIARRIRWVREAKEPDIEQVAAVMRVLPETWLLWEMGLQRPPTDKLAEFAQRFGVSIDFLWFGKLIGIDADFQIELLDRHPELRPPGYLPPYSRRDADDDNNIRQTSSLA